VRDLLRALPADAEVPGNVGNPPGRSSASLHLRTILPQVPLGREPRGVEGRRRGDEKGESDGPRGGEYFLADVSGGRIVSISRKPSDDRV